MKKLMKTILAMAMAAALVISVPAAVKADEAADAAAAQAQLELLMQTPEYQAALAALQAQYAAAAQAQYEAALAAWNNAQYLQQSAVNQAYTMNAIMFLQRAQVQGLVEKQGLDYENLIYDYIQKSQNAALNSFKGYNGLQ